MSFGGIALVVAVRRQIKISSGDLDNFRTFGSMIVTLPSRRPSTPEDLDIYASGGVKELSASLPPAVTAFPTNPTAIPITTSLPPRCDPASQLRREPTRTSVRPMSRAVVRELAMQSDIEGGARKEHAKNLMALQRAEADLFVVSLPPRSASLPPFVARRHADPPSPSGTQKTSLSVLLIMVPVGIIMVWGATVLQRLPEMPFFAFVPFPLPPAQAYLPG